MIGSVVGYGRRDVWLANQSGAAVRPSIGVLERPVIAWRVVNRSSRVRFRFERSQQTVARCHGIEGIDRLRSRSRYLVVSQLRSRLLVTRVVAHAAR
ncbi:hypothetical protein AB1N83_009763 [Pleurotus pulmonarius]